MSSEVERTPRPAAWKDVPDAQWDDWRWQLSHRLNTMDELAKVITSISPDEKSFLARLRASAAGAVR